MNIQTIRNVTVVGAGAMGSQIVQLLALTGGYPVTVTDVSQDAIDKGIRSIGDGLTKFFVEKGKMTSAQAGEVMARITGAADLSQAVKNADFIIEAAFENLEVKKGIFQRADQFAPAHAIIASNTSMLNISEMAAATKRPGRVVGMHFFNPVAVMKLVEVARGTLTSAETQDVTVELARKLGKEPVVCKDFSFGFLANRAYVPMQIEAIAMVWERVAPPADIDKALKLGYNLPMGPLELGDFAGSWGILMNSEQDRIRELGSAQGHLHPMLRMMVRAGYSGGRGKKGVYDFYNEVLSKG